MIDSDFHLQYIDQETGEWVAERHPLNDRGDVSSELQKCDSIKKYGLILDMSSGAWLVDKVAHKCKRFSVVHMATRIGGLRRAWQEDQDRTNAMVQMSLRRGMEHCKRYKNTIPDWAVRFPYVSIPAPVVGGGGGRVSRGMDGGGGGGES